MSRNVIYEKSYAKLDELLEAWYEFLCNRDELCIAISRKAPRLLEWCAARLKTQNILNVVSEIAIPFIDLSTVKSCSLVDEAIYHGTTFSKIYSLITSSYRDIELKASPLVVTEEALSHLTSYNVHLEAITKTISDEYASFFIDTVIKRFHEELKPYDMEYPLLYFTLDGNADSMRMEKSLSVLEQLESKKLGRNLQGCFYMTETYSRERGEGSKSYSYIFEYRFDGNLSQSKKPDFAKLRFMTKGNEVCMAVMSPYVISDYDIEKEGRIFTDGLKPVWDELYTAAARHADVDEEYLYQKKKSLVVMANYLLSYNNFLLLKQHIMQAFGVNEIELKAADLDYLVGKELSSSLTKTLNGIGTPMSSMNVFELNGSLANSYIPYAQKEAYQRRTGLYNLFSKTISARVSNLFCAMHWEVEMNSRHHTSENYYSRLRFGESYQSLMEMFRYADMSQGELRLSLHKNIDSRIDSGSVVPNYVRIEHLPQYWLRLFRSGENEDVTRDQFNRIALFLVRQYMKYSGWDTMPVIALQLALLLMVYEDHGKNSRYFCHVVDFSRSGNSVKSFIKIDDNYLDIYKKISESGLFGTTDQGSLYIKDNTDSQMYSNGSPLSKDMDESIVSIVSFVYDYCNNQAKWNHTKINQIFKLLAFDYDSLLIDLKNWSNDIRLSIESETPINIELEKNEFIEKLMSIPMPDFAVQNHSKGVWTERMKELVDEFSIHADGCSECERLLMRNAYVLNTWCGLKGYDQDDLISSEEYRQLFIDCFKKEERNTLMSCSEMPLQEAKTALLGML